MNKKAMELSINALVIIIISLVMLGSSIALLSKFMGKSDDLYETLDKRTEDELRSLLVGQGRTVALPFNTKSLHGGESHLFGLGIMNINEQTTFSYAVELSRFVDNDGNTRTNEVDIEPWLLYYKGELDLKENENTQQKILVTVDKAALKGQYIFNVKVEKSVDQTFEPYGNTQKFTVIVE